MITGDYEQLKDLIGVNVCAECGGFVSVAWHKDKSCYFIKCGECGECKALTRTLSLTEEHRAGKLPDGPVKDNVEKGMAKRDRKSTTVPVANTMGGVPATDLGTGELLQFEALRSLVDYAHHYELDPGREHVVMMYGKPYVTLDGYLYHAHQVNNPYEMRSRPLTDEERGPYKIDVDDHAWICEIVKTVSGSLHLGIGVVTKEEMEEKSKRNPEQLASPVVARYPWQLAQKRAEWQALRRAFPIGNSRE